MAAFPHHNPAFLFDSLLLPNTTMTYPPPSQLLQHNPIDVAPHANSNEPLSKSDSSSMVIELDSDDHKETSFDTKRKKNTDGSCLSSAQSQDMRGIKAKRQRKCKEGEEKKNNSLKKDQKKVAQEPPTGYIHVRARRGQATDSHSLAERVRREKISERMRLLQGLVPGCDKVTGKALMLDEIINYVQSLQYQVEFLSMKLASVNPVLHDFGADMNEFMVKPEKPLESIMHQSPSFADNSTKNNYSLQDNAAPFLSQQGQMLTAFPQDNENLLWDVYDQRQRLLNQYGFSNLCSF